MKRRNTKAIPQFKQQKLSDVFLKVSARSESENSDPDDSNETGSK